MSVPAVGVPFDYTMPVLSTALAHVVETLSVPVGRALVAPGAAPAWDACCEGMAYTRLILLAPAQMYGGRSNVDGSGGGAYGPCGVLAWQATIGVGVLRCASVVNDAGEAPSARVLTAEARQVLDDAAAVAFALQCHLAPQVERLSLLQWEPLGPEGGCVGGEWQANVLIPNCPCGDSG